ncbi:UNVERIFIED_CONTAM: hypothetical protein K2H54_048596 [Gekko kuhli]
MFQLNTGLKVLPITLNQRGSADKVACGFVNKQAVAMSNLLLLLHKNAGHRERAVDSTRNHNSETSLLEWLRRRDKIALRKDKIKETKSVTMRVTSCSGSTSGIVWLLGEEESAVVPLPSSISAMTSAGPLSRFLTSVLRNGVGRYVCQLQRLTLTLSRDAPSSRGVREYVEEKVVDFARQNPGIVLYVCPKKSRVPTVEAEYLNGTVEVKPLTSKTADEVAEIIQTLANQSGLEIIRIRKPFHTDNPSIQGQWHPFTNKRSVLNVQEIGQQCLSSPQK